MLTYWEDAPKDKAPIVAYSCYKSRIAVYQRDKLVSYLPHVEKLPYTEIMLTRRLERGADVPSWFTQEKAA